MANRLLEGLTHLSTRMRAHAGTSVTYRRGSHAVTVDATQGTSEHTMENLEGAMISGRTDDWLITPSALAAIGKPRRGDIISYTRGGTTRTFQVTSPFGQNCYQLVDYDQAYRIHTDEISET